MKTPSPSWLVPVITIFMLQTLSAFLSRLIPVVAPAMANEFGWAGSSIGYLSASNSLGGALILFTGSTFLRRVGGTRALQVALLCGAVSMGMFFHPAVAMAVAACFIMGTSNGAANPAGSEVLQRFSPPGMRNLLFSVKQAGVPVGGMAAGLLLPFLIALSSWRIALLICAIIVLIPTLWSWRLSRLLDAPPKPRKTEPAPSFRETLSRFRLPLPSWRHSSELFRTSIVGSSFAIPQGCWFTFTAVYLVDRLGYSLSLAGLVFAIMQLGGILGRIGLGWLSDHLRSARSILSVTAVFSAATTALLGATNPGWPLWVVILIAFVAGCTAASWNGVQLAEVARHSPPQMITETAAGASLMVNLVNVVAPTLFALAVTALGRYDIAYYVAGACALLVPFVLPQERALED